MKISIIFFLPSFYTCFAEETKACSTPSGQEGTCRSILECPFLKGLAMKEHMSKQEIYHLRRSACGFKNSIPLVCCPEYGSKFCVPAVRPPDPWTGCCGRTASEYHETGTSIPELGQYPWMALIEYDLNNKSRIICSATLISNRYLLSAAHCFSGTNIRNLSIPTKIRLGEFDVQNEGPDCVDTYDSQVCTDGAIRVSIQRALVHPAYNERQRLNDISLIRLSEMVPYTDFIRPICLPTMDITANPPSRLQFYVAGWGATETAADSDVLRHVELPHVPLEICQKRYNRLGHVTLTNGHVCAGGLGSDACKGDTGGPLMHDTGLYQEVIGVVSFGPLPCGLKNIPGGYSKIIIHNQWIRDNIEP